MGATPPGCTPWLVSLATEPLPGGEQSRRLWDPTVTSKFRNLLDEKEFKVSFPRGQAVACCGSFRGWLVVANELSDLVLYNPFTAALLPLPPLTGFSSCIEGVYADEGNVIGYRCRCHHASSNSSVYDMDSLGRHFYDKVVLSGSPSARPAVALAIHLDGKRLSFARIRVVLDKDQDHCVSVYVDRLDRKSCQMVGVSPAKALRGHAALLGQNSPGLLSVEKFPELRPDCIYFTTPRLRGDIFER
ncbi:hypothetical protein VPH35_139858 [Triticum aestivum]